MDVGGWLRSLGLGQYEDTFRANEIDIDVLPELTEIDPEKLGVPLGHRKRLLKAIARLGAPEKLPPTLSPAPVRTDTDAAERRQVTVMFSDLVGSTALSARMDWTLSRARSRPSAAPTTNNGSPKFTSGGALVQPTENQ